MQDTIVYDKAKYHFDAESYPKDLPTEQAYVHTGMFLGWIIDRDLYNKEFFNELGIQKDVDAFKGRQVSGAMIYRNLLDGTLTNEDLNEEGNRFAQSYFDFERGQYIEDYMKLFGLKVDNNYVVKDTWENYEKIRKIIERRYLQWKKGGLKGFFSKIFS